MKRKLKKLAALALAGCMALSVTAYAEEKTPDPAISEGKTLIVGLQGDPASFNPTAAPDDWGYYVAENMFSRLVKLNWKGETLPDLAESWEIAEDGLTVTFHLHEDAKWSDGEPVTAADVKWTFDKIVEDQAYLVSYLGSVESIEAADDYTVVFHMSAPDAALLSNISFLGAFILPQHVYEGQDWMTCEAATSAPVTSGPFMLEDYQQGVAVTLTANKEFYDGAPAYDKLVYQIIPDGNTAVQAYNNGELDVLGIMAPASQIGALESDPGNVVVYNANFGRYYYGFNVKSEALSDVKVREAITMAVDRQEIVDKAFGAAGQLAQGYYTPAVEWAYNADAQIPAFDQEKAVALLEEAGLTKDSDGNYLTLSIATFNLEPFTNIAQIMQANLAEIGVKLDINTMEAAAYMEISAEEDAYDLFAMGGQVGPDPSMFYHRIGTNGTMNFSHYSNGEVDAMFEEAAGMTDQGERGELYKKIQEICAEEYLIVPLSEDIGINVYKTYLIGLPYDKAVNTAAQTEMTRVMFTEEPQY